MYVTKQMHTHRYKKHTSGCQCRDGSRKVQDRSVQLNIQTTIYTTDRQPGYIERHRELEPMFCSNLKWSIISKETESLCCIPEINILY